MAEMTVSQDPTGPDAPTQEQGQEQQQAAPASQPAASPQQDPGQQQGQQPQVPQQQQQQMPPDEAVANFVKDAGFDPQTLAKEIVSTGTIGADARKTLAERLEKVGLPAGLIDGYIEGQKASANAMVQDVLSAAGGSEGFREMAAWAQFHLPEAEIVAFNKVMETADAQTAKLMMGTMYARYQAAVPSGGRRIRGDGSPGGGGDVFRSWTEQVEAQKDPRYANDPGFRDMVEQKIERTLKRGGYNFSTR
jgi:hypothetical protein